jgi:hypothetical protein
LELPQLAGGDREGEDPLDALAPSKFWISLFCDGIYVEGLLMRHADTLAYGELA